MKKDRTTSPSISPRTAAPTTLFTNAYKDSPAHAEAERGELEMDDRVGRFGRLGMGRVGGERYEKLRQHRWVGIGLVGLVVVLVLGVAVWGVVNMGGAGMVGWPPA